jgi:hypothetical protein
MSSAKQEEVRLAMLEVWNLKQDSAMRVGEVWILLLQEIDSRREHGTTSKKGK